MKSNSFESLKKLWRGSFQCFGLFDSDARLAVAACAIAASCSFSVGAQAAPQTPTSTPWRDAVEHIRSGFINMDAVARNDFGPQLVSESIKFGSLISGDTEVVRQKGGGQSTNNCDNGIADGWGVPKAQSLTQLSADTHKVSDWWRTVAFGLAGALISMLTVLLAPIIREIAQDIVWAIRGRIGSRIDVEDVTSLMVSRELARRLDPDSTHK